MPRKLLALFLFALSTPALAIDSTLTYQGSLEDAGQAATGSYDLQFTLQDSAGVTIGSVLLRDNVAVSGGVFTVELDFGAAAFTGADRFLQIGVRPGSSIGAFTALTPRTRLTPAPYAQVADDALFAASIADDSVTSAKVQIDTLTAADIAAGAVGGSELVDGSVGNVDLAANAVTSSKIQDGTIGSVDIADGGVSVFDLADNSVQSAQIGTSAVTDVDIGPQAVGASEIKPGEVQARVVEQCASNEAIRAIDINGGVDCSSLSGWSLTGNVAGAASVLGTTNDMPLRLQANNAIAAIFEREADAINVVLGSSSNYVQAGALGGTISGGGRIAAPSANEYNRVTDHYGTIAGGIGNLAGNGTANLADAEFATVGGGVRNRASGEGSVVAGGEDNAASGLRSSVSGGRSQIASGDYSAIVGGNDNDATGDYSAVLGGQTNASSGNNSTVIGGVGSTASHLYAAAAGVSCAGGAYSWAIGTGAAVRPGSGSGEAGVSCASVPLSGDADGDEGSFVWSGVTSPYSTITSTGPNQFIVRAGGGVMFNTSALLSPADDLVIRTRAGGSDADVDLRLVTQNNRLGLIYLKDDVGSLVLSAASLANGANRLEVPGGSGGVATLSHGGTWTNASSRSFKAGFAAIDPLDVLARVVELPITTWRYRDSTEGTHMGPMAEDFKAAFDLAGDGRSIATVDADGEAHARQQEQLGALAKRLARIEGR